MHAAIPITTAVATATETATANTSANVRAYARDCVGPLAAERGYVNPYAAGIALGLVLFASIVLAGRGLGASGGFTASATAALHTVAPLHVEQHPYLSQWLPTSRAGALGDWAVLELLGVAIGAVVSARLAGRIRAYVESTQGEPSRARLARAIVGGVMLGAGSRLARGCTSGLGLTGGALLSTGAWIFIPVAFATAFGMAWALRRWPVTGSALATVSAP
jgi:uncharacterized membrane protein YedE/YeeE